MKNLYLATLLLAFIFSACEKDTVTPEKKDEISAKIDTIIFSGDTLQVSFGYFGDEEGITIISQAKNAKACELLNEHWEERILQYISLKNFQGIDSISLVTQRGSDGASASTDIDSILVVIRVLKNDFHKKLIGEWMWSGSCGGISGACCYPVENDSLIIAFGYDMKYVKSHYNTIENELDYKLLEATENSGTIIYEIELSNGSDSYIWLTDDFLHMQGGDYVEDFHKIVEVY